MDIGRVKGDKSRVLIDFKYCSLLRVYRIRKLAFAIGSSIYCNVHGNKT